MNADNIPAPPVPPDRHASVFTEAAGWVFVLATVYAPWAFGSRPYWAALTLAGLLFVAEGLWLAGCRWEWHWPAVPPLCWVLVILLATQAGVSFLNPRSVFDAERLSFLPSPAYVPFLPGTADARTGWSFTVEMLAYLGVIPVAADLSRLPVWRRRFAGAVVFTGLTVAVAGLSLKAGCLPTLAASLAARPWAHGKIFGPFDYHGNAGAFLNLVLPFAAARTAVAEGRWGRILWRTAVGGLYLALVINTSRAALGIGLALSPLCLWLLWPVDPSRRSGLSLTNIPWKPLAGVLAAAFAVLIVVIRLEPEPVRRRLFHLPDELRQSENPRYIQSRVAWEMAQDRPLFGAGVGTYKVLVQTTSIRGYFFAPFFRPGDPFTVLGQALEDYFQTLVEWGWVGLCLWSALVAGAFVKLWGFLRRTGFGSRTALVVGVSLVSVYLHAVGDCPLQTPALQFYVSFLLGMAWGCNTWRSDSIPERVRS